MEFYGDEPNNGAEVNINYSIKDSKSFDYETSTIGKFKGNNVEKHDIKISVPLKYLSNFWRTLDIPLINCEISLDVTWPENCVLTSKASREADPDTDPAITGMNNSKNVTFKITDCKLYVPIVTLSAENDNKLLEQLRTDFKITATQDKYRSEISN